MRRRWVEFEHSKKAVQRASKVIGKGVGTPEDVQHARDVLSNYRLAHAYPLNAVTMTARSRARQIDANAIVAERRKRLPTILDKLERHPNMSVTTMQDLGGCRVVFDSVAKVDQLVLALQDLPRARNKVIKVNDYLRDDPGPRDSGYRGVHLIYEYGASKVKYRGLRIELQVRTQLQHAWATAVETVDLFSGSELKYGKGDPDLLRYFVLVSSLMAHIEDTSRVPSADESPRRLTSELTALEVKLNVLGTLRGYASIVGEYATSDRRSVLTLELRRRQRKLAVRVHETIALAEARLTELEAIDDDNLDAVLVEIAKISQLRDAYPNYYADTDRFAEFVSFCFETF